jgi:hypothetical protein
MKDGGPGTIEFVRKPEYLIFAALARFEKGN